MTNLTSHPDYK